MNLRLANPGSFDGVTRSEAIRALVAHAFNSRTDSDWVRCYILDSDAIDDNHFPNNFSTTSAVVEDFEIYIDDGDLTCWVGHCRCQSPVKAGSFGMVASQLRAYIGPDVDNAVTAYTSSPEFTGYKTCKRCL
jgi:hypothetical protein